MSVFDALNVAHASGLLKADISGVMEMVYKIPLAKEGFAWLIPTIIGFAVGALWGNLQIKTRAAEDKNHRKRTGEE